MKLTAKLVAVLILVITILASFNCFLTVMRVKQEAIGFAERAHEMTSELGAAIEKMLGVLSPDGSPPDAQRLVRTTLTENIRWVDNHPENPEFPNVPHDRLRILSVDRKLISEVRDYDRNGTLEDYWMISINSKPMGGLEIRHPTVELSDRTRAAILEQVLQTIIALTVGGIAIAFIGITAIGRPLKKIIDKTKQIGNGDLSHPINIQSRDELSDLGKALNDMCRQLSESQERIREESAARVSAVEQLRHAERLQMIGKFASGIAHELGTPLNVISGRAGLIESGKLTAEDSVASAKIIKSETERITAMVRQLLDFARRKPSQKLPADLRNIFDRTVGLLEQLAKKRKITIEVEQEDSPIMVLVDATQIQQVLNNLLANAAHAMPGGGKINVGFVHDITRPPEMGNADEANGQKYVCIRLQDEGEGISEEDLPHIFEPFFTTKTADTGTGLGLSISLGIAQDHGGWISVDSQKGNGSCFSLYLPALPSS